MAKDFICQLFTASVQGEIGPMARTTPARTVGVTFKPSATRPTLCIYSVSIQTAAGTAEVAEVKLLSDAASPPTVVQSQVAGGLSGTVPAGLVGYSELTIIALVEPDHFVQIARTNLAGNPTVNIVAQTEITL